MSDNIPFEIHVEIIKRLPIKLLIQVRSVSKQWKSLIDSSQFITNYTLFRAQPQHLLVSYIDPKDNNSDKKYVSILDDDTFPKHKFSHNVPMSVKLLNEPIIFSSLGLLCFYCTNASPDDSGNKAAVIWNPTIRKSAEIAVPNALEAPYETVVGFGVCPNTFDPMLVKVTFSRDSGGSDTIVEVFRLSMYAWRRLSVNLPRKAIYFTHNQVAIDRFVYWLVCDKVAADAGSDWYDLIMSFDMTTEDFKEIHIPDKLAFDHDSTLYISISKLRESLVVIQVDPEAEKPVYSVWMMEDVIPKSFKLIFSINTPDFVQHVYGFRKGGEPIIEIGNDDDGDSLFDYEPNSKHINYIGITGERWTHVNFYMETLLLLDH